ncbi:unnamed protein product [Symbiodinium pilosum]|uniref:Endonuclease/exonuclease/phosphatase domain-containing protein n=1 Tax=Symbiodinium pilosum TaxID=2952 RepID=A0A812Q1N6_SYMPI|nr:unnamed protein product [Symbiodinium pilosum]
MLSHFVQYVLHTRGLSSQVSRCVPLHVSWTIAAWNQHRKSSYFQKDCVWVSTLQRLGYATNDIMDAVADLKVRYSPSELQRWVSGYDVVAVQEADPLFREALGEMGQGMVCGSNDFDGRGVEVESCSALILRNARCLHKESALLSFRSFRGATVSREHLVAHLEHSTGEQLVVCSVHLHVPAMIRKRLNYADYLLPLRHALENVAGQQTLEIPCLLLGDFNLDPADFHQLSIDDAFWKQLLGMRITLSVANVLPCCCMIFSSATFHLVPCDKFRPVVPQGGTTAHASNPSARGDFALVTAGQWRGKALGSPSFKSFERYGSQVSQALSKRIRLKEVIRRCEEARCGLQRAENSLSNAARDAFLLHDTGEQAPLVQLRQARLELNRAELRLRRSLRHSASPMRRTLSNSDHRPLHFERVLAKEALKP